MDNSTPIGTWYLLANTSRLELKINASGSGFTGTIANEGGPQEPVTHFHWDSHGRWLEFRRDGPGFFQWYRLCLTYGVVAGRFSHSTLADKPGLIAYAWHVTGWSPDWLDSGIVPRTWNIAINGAFQAVLRIDHDATGALQGRLKVYDNTSVVGAQEELENDLTAVSWNGTNLSFTRNGPGFTQQYTGTASGRFINGTFTHNGGAPARWTGARGEVLGFGLGSRLAHRADWQAAMRGRVVNLTEGMRLSGVGIPPVIVQDQGAVGLFTGGQFLPERDDDPNSWPPNYTLHRLQFSVSPGSRFDPANPPPPRVFNGYIARPTGAAPAGGFRAVVAVNGHGGSAELVMTSANPTYWYGDSAARRDLVVLAIDIGHRPKWNAGPIVHPAIVDAGYADSNWEEDGERAYSVRRAIDWLLSQPNIRQDRVFMFGLSLGGEITTITSGLDPRIAMAVPAGFSPDMHVMDVNGNHPCYQWDHANIHEYLDVSDWEALIAPRPLVVETGIQDGTFSPLHPPFSADKQVTRRARAAYGQQANHLIHYLHYDQHAFHVGGKNPTNGTRPKGILEAAVTAPTPPGSMSWQTDSTTTLRSPTLYDLMNQFLP
jgi:hypothetical protein